MPCGMCHITPFFWRCLRKIVQLALEVRVVQEVQKKEVEVEKGSEGEGTIRGHQMWRTQTLPLRWWIRKEYW